MSEQRERDNNLHNSIYYNQLLRASEKKKTRPARRKSKSFGAKQVDLSKYLVIPTGYEGIFYTIYFLAIPWIVGITFLFFYVAEGAYSNFSLLDLTSFLIVWAIGYEITSAIILTFIFFAFIKHLKEPE